MHRDSAAEAVADEPSLLNTKGIQQPQKILGHGERIIAGGRHVTQAVSSQVICGHGVIFDQLREHFRVPHRQRGGRSRDRCRRPDERVCATLADQNIVTAAACF